MELFNLAVPVQVGAEKIKGYQENRDGNHKAENRKYGKSADHECQRKYQQNHSNAEFG